MGSGFEPPDGWEFLMQTQPNQKTQTYRAEDITCDHCVRTIRQALLALPGVKEVEVDLPSKTVKVTQSGAIPETDILATLSEEGYPATRLADDVPAASFGNATASCCRPPMAGFSETGMKGACHVD